MVVEGDLVKLSTPSGSAGDGGFSQVYRQSCEDFRGRQDGITLGVVCAKAEDFARRESAGGVWCRAGVSALVSSSEFASHGGEVSGLGGA